MSKGLYYWYKEHGRCPKCGGDPVRGKVFCVTCLDRATDCVKCKKDAEPVKHACWTPGTRGADSYLRCTNCHKIVVNNIVTLEGDAAETAFERCPYCGAKMDGGADNA